MLDVIRSQAAYQHCLDAIKVGTQSNPLGLARSSRLPILAALCSDLNVPVLLLTDRADRAMLMYDELGFWLSGISRFYFPEPNPMFYEQAAWGSVTRRDRLLALGSLAQYHLPGRQKPDEPVVIVAPLRAVMTRTLPRRDFLLSSKTIHLNQKVNPEILQRNWVQLGYENVDVVVDHGQFSRRGGILDVWTPVDTFPARLEFFGDEIDTLRQFDPTTQRTVRSLEQLLVTPAREYIQPQEGLQDLDGREFDEFEIPLMHPAASTILDYLPRNALVFIDDLSHIQSFGDEIEEQALKIRADSVQEGTIPADFPVPYLSWSEIIDTVQTRRWVELGKPYAENSDELGMKFVPGARFAGHLKSFMEKLDDYCTKSESTFIVSRQLSRLKEIWGDHSGTCDSAEVTFREATLGEGWDLNLDDGNVFHFITDGEIFGWERPAPRARIKVTHHAPESDYADLKVNDWVVHVDYGIGKFAGLVTRTLEGTEREFLLVEYEGGDQLYVPIHQADRLSRYIGTEGGQPHASRLGSGEWSQTKQTVREEVIKIAQDLLDLYAKRQTAEGYAFGTDTPWQQELEASFPYVETEDQLKSIHDVKKDMETPRPMDRLLCGDVGYGKTEVALRAAFKAVMDGKQVAILVPTTVLAQQHFETFRQRLCSFPGYC